MSNGNEQVENGAVPSHDTISYRFKVFRNHVVKGGLLVIHPFKMLDNM